MSKELTEITSALGKAYKNWKAYEVDKDKEKKRFFEAISFPELAESWAEVYAPNEDVAKEILERQNPSWLVDELRFVDEGHYEAILVENPNLKPFVFVNPKDKMVYSRQVSAGPVLLDDERLRDEDPELWRKVTVIPLREVFAEIMYHCNVDNGDIDHYLDDLFPLDKRELVELKTLDEVTLGQIAEYVYEGKPTVKLGPPRKAKTEELE